MKKYEVGYSRYWHNYPIAYWVHIEKDNKPWRDSVEYSPPSPKKDYNGIYKIYKIEINGFTFVFFSIDQLEHCIEILSMKLLPATITLSEKRPGNMGPNSHWLSRLPAKVKPWSYREKAVKYLKKVREELEKQPITTPKKILGSF